MRCLQVSWITLLFTTYSSLQFHNFRHPFVKFKCTTTSSSSIVYDSPPALVFNEVLDRQQGHQISDFFYNFSEEASKNGGSSSVQSQSASISFRIFNRNEVIHQVNSSSMGFNYIEKVLSSILHELDDNSKFVEYWWRGHWNSHVLHRDVDELLLIQKDVERFPRNAHVLYLNFDEELSLQSGGHTVVLEDSSRHRQLFVVPPHPGRLLRFQGHLLHGVPRPAFEFYLCDQEPEWIQNVTSSLRLEVPLTINYSLSSNTAVKRSVLLFNTWDDTPPVPVQGTSNQHDSLANDVQADLPPICNPIHQWQAIPFISPVSNTRNNLHNSNTMMMNSLNEKESKHEEEEEVATLRLALPEDRRRRDRYEKTLTLQSHCESDVRAFWIDQNLPDRPPVVITLTDNYQE